MKRRSLLAFTVLLAACGTTKAESTTPTANGATQPTSIASDASTGAPTETATAVATASTSPSASASATASSSKAPRPIPKITILIIGDSFAAALGAGLKAKEAETGIKIIQRGEKATYIPEWAGTNKNVAGLMLMNKPDLVVIALGGNELEMKTPEIRAPKVKKLVEQIGATPCVWVSPPLWGNKDNGLLGVIRDNSLPCRHFDSNVLAPDLPRGGDKIHPTADGQKKWAGHFLDWLSREQTQADGEKLTLGPRVAGE